MHFFVTEEDGDHNHKAQNETETETGEEMEKGIAIGNKKEGKCNTLTVLLVNQSCSYQISIFHSYLYHQQVLSTLLPR